MLNEDCHCDACWALAEKYANDPALLAFYRKKLLVRGWAGQSDPVEKAYVLAHSTWAQASAASARRHGFGGKCANQEALAVAGVS